MTLQRPASGEGTVSTGQDARLTTRSATLPIMACASPVRPCVPTTIRLAPISSATRCNRGRGAPLDNLGRARQSGVPEAVGAAGKLEVGASVQRAVVGVEIERPHRELLRKLDDMENLDLRRRRLGHLNRAIDRLVAAFGEVGCHQNLPW